MDFINKMAGSVTAEEWQAIGAIGTLIVAIAAATFAFFQVREASRLRRDQSRPYVVLYAERVAPTIVDLVVKNFGTTAARDVVLHWDRPAMMRWEQGAEPMELFDRLPVLVPGQEWRTLWDLNGHRIEDEEDPYVVSVTSQDNRGRKLPEERFDLDTRHFAYEMMWDRNGLHEIGESLKRIEGSIRHWGDGSDGLRVWVRDGTTKDTSMRQRMDDQRAARLVREVPSPETEPAKPKRRGSRKPPTDDT